MSAPPSDAASPPQCQAPSQETSGQYPNKAPLLEQPAPAYSGPSGYLPSYYRPEGYPIQQQGSALQQLGSHTSGPGSPGFANAPVRGYSQALLQSQSAISPETVMPWRHIMASGLCDCCAVSYGGGFSLCCLAFFCPGCIFGTTYKISDQGTYSCGSCCYPCLCGKSRSHIQRLLGVADEGCCLGCMFHCSVLTSACALVQEFRAVTAWFLAGKPTADATPPALTMSRTYI